MIRTRVEKVFMLSYDPPALSCDSLEESDLRMKRDDCVCKVAPLIVVFLRMGGGVAPAPGIWARPVFHPKIPGLILQMEAHHTV